jgi:hypothetical protein
MIEETEIAGIINKIHPFTLILFWMHDRSVYGIYKLGHGHIAYLKLPHAIAAKGSKQELLHHIHVEGSHHHPESLSIDEFVAGIKRTRVRKIWLTSKGDKNFDVAFLTLKELKDFLRSTSQ